jgi:general nucleoside transport system permease protein
VLMSARIPWLFEPPYRVHYGVFIALLAVIFVWWLIYKTTIGFEIRTVGQNLRAARYAGMRVNWVLIFTIALAGGLAGLAGAIETLGLNHKFAPEFGGGVGFDGITVALLGQTHPFGVLLASFLFGAMDAGAARMQFQSGVAADIIQVIQALILAMVAAPAIIRMIYRIRQVPAETDAAKLSQGWGGS